MVYARMPFGMYKGERIDEIPEGYLRWALQTCDLQVWLRRAIEDVLGEWPHVQAAPKNATPSLDVKGILDRWYREMTMRFHPDRFGSHEAITAINHAHDRLKQLVGIK
jgi:hypothetical protein